VKLAAKPDHSGRILTRHFAGVAGTPAEHSPLAVQSLDHYAKMNGASNFIPKIQNGFPRVAIATMSAMAGRSDQACVLTCSLFHSQIALSPRVTA
jgi:hypothetical protein